MTSEQTQALLYPTTEEEENSSSSSCCTATALLCGEIKYPLLVNIFGGLLYGFAIGILPLTMQYDQYINDCARYTSRDACSPLTFAGCIWNASESRCDFPDYKTVNCSLYRSLDSCSQLSGGDCHWRYHKAECVHNVGWSPSEQGLLAGLQIVGALASSSASGALANFIGRRKTLSIVSGIGGIIASALFVVGWNLSENYPLLVVSQFVIGFASGTLGVVCPLYVAEQLREHRLKNIVGAVFQICCVSGVFIAAVLGLVLDPEQDTSRTLSETFSLQNRFYVPIAAQFAMCFFVLFITSCIIPESALWLEERRLEEDRKRGVQTDDDLVFGRSSITSQQQKQIFDGDGDRGKCCCSKISKQLQCCSCCCASSQEQSEGNRSCSCDSQQSIILPICLGVALAGAMSLSGLQAIMIYAPSMAAKAGLTPFQGNFAVSSFNICSVFGSLFWTRNVSSPRKLFVTCALLVSLSCAFVGIVVYPGVLEHGSKMQHILSSVGILLVVFFYQSGVGPSFYPLACDNACGFPQKYRALGASFVLWSAFLCALMTNFGFPVVRTAIAGGLSGDDDKGFSGCFFIFAGVGFCSACFLALKMK